MQLILNRLVLEHFKGVKRAEYRFSGVTRIRGRNASGKSSIFDAFCWLLFNKDSRGNAPGSDDFHEKPLDSVGNEIHNLDTMVEADFMLDGQPFNLRRIQRESWVKTRGSLEAQYKGNVSYYWINDVETKVTDFRARIDGIAGRDVFMLVSKLGAFNDLGKEKRRSVLLSMSGVDVDAELLARDEFSHIANEAAALNVGIDDLRKVFSERRRRINQDLTVIPARIDEAIRGKPSYTEDELRDAEYNLKDALEQLESCNRTLAKLESGDDAAADLRRRILDLETQLVSEKQRISDDHDAMRRRLGQIISGARDRLCAAQTRQASAEDAFSRAQDVAGQLQSKVDDLRAQYRDLFKRVYQPDHLPDVCPTCGQVIPQQQRAKAAAEAREQFERDKKAGLSDIRERGQRAALELQKAQSTLEARDSDVRNAREAVMAAQVELSTAEDNLRVAPASPDFSAPRLIELEAQIHDLRQKDCASPDARIAAARDRIRDLQARADRAREILAKRELAEKADARIAELKDQQRGLGQKMADLEIAIYELEQFITARCKLLEDSINDLFPTVRWKLFDRQINGAIVDCCECMMLAGESLVSYSGGNTGSRVNADIEIIDVLQRHYGLTAPVFVDNAESVNDISIPSGQLITLSVSTDDELTFEYTDAKKEAA